MKLFKNKKLVLALVGIAGVIASVFFDVDTKTIDAVAASCTKVVDENTPDTH